MVIESKGGAAEPVNLVLNEEDLAYEEEILRNPHAIKVKTTTKTVAKIILNYLILAVDSVHWAQGWLTEEYPEYDLWESTQGAAWKLQAVVQLS